MSERNINLIKKQQKDNPILEEIHLLDACDMGMFKAESFDVVLCMGALYHLFERKQHERVIKECKRVCKKNGIIVFSYLNKWGSFYNGFINNLKPIDMLYQEFESGNNENIFFRTTPEEIDALCKVNGLECIYNVGVDHISYLSSEKIDSMNREEYERLLKYQRRASQNKNISGTSLHGLWIGKK